MKDPQKILKANKYANETVLKITNVVCGYFKLPSTIFKSKSRKRNVIIAKQFIIFFIKEFLPELTLKEVAHYCNYTNHCNIIYTIKTVKNNIEFDSKFKGDYNELNKLLNAINTATQTDKNVLDVCYYIDLNNVYSAKTKDGKAIIFSGFHKDEVFESLSLLPSMISTESVKKHQNTNLFILENDKHDSD